MSDYNVGEEAGTMTTTAGTEDRQTEAENEPGSDGGDQGGTFTSGPAPAYSSYAGHKAMLDQLRDEGIPPVFDRSYFGNKSGGLIAQVRGTLRFLGLTDSGHRPTQQLFRLVDATPDERTVMMRGLLEEHYAQELALSRERGTYGQLAALFRERGLTGATAAKAATFLVHAMKDVGMEVSPYFSQGRPSTTGASGSRTRKRRTAPASPAVAPAPAPAAPPATSQETQRLRYVEMLMKLAESSAQNGVEPSMDLLDRIEKALGYQEAARAE